MRQTATICGILILVVLVLMIVAAPGQVALSQTPGSPNIPRGGALFDNWMGVTGQPAPSGSHPIWASQNTNTISGADTWRCVTCHGWDYQGKAGAFRSGTNYTGFPGVFAETQNKTPADIIAALSGKTDPAHDFSKYLDAASMTDLAVFIKTALINDNQYIDPLTFDVIGGSASNGKGRYQSACASCHGDDGNKITTSFEGYRAGLGTLAAVDPWRFLHKTRFGTPGTPMVIGYDLGWTAQDGRDVLAYAQQAFKTGQEKPTSLPVVPNNNTQAVPEPGWFTGVLTALGAILASAGFAILLGSVLVIVIFIVVWSMRNNK
jgi:mono/diheme cytochrome c family protein